MNPYFSNPDRQEQLWAAAKRWEGTPFFANGSSSTGIGCVNLINELGVETGAFPRLELPVYSLDRGHHTAESQLLPFLLENPHLKGRLVFVPVNGTIIPGDIFGVLQGQLDHHLACALKWGKVVHSVRSKGVIISNQSDDEFARRVLYVLRPLEVQA